MFREQNRKEKKRRIKCLLKIAAGFMRGILTELAQSKIVHIIEDSSYKMSQTEFLAEEIPLPTAPQSGNVPIMSFVGSLESEIATSDCSKLAWQPSHC